MTVSPVAASGPLLLLARLGREQYLNLHLADEAGSPVDEALTTALEALTDLDYVRADSGCYALTDEGSEAVEDATRRRCLLDGAEGDTSSGDRALWTWLLLHGGDLGPYDTTVEMTAPCWHLLACGLDLTRSGSVQDDTWTIWGGTFGDNDRETGVSGSATCRCGSVRNLQLLATVPSVTDLLRQVLAH